MDRVLAQIKNDIMKDSQIVNTAKTGNRTAYNSLSEKEFDNVAMNRYEENDLFFKTLFSDAEKFKYIKKRLLDEIYNEIRNLKE